MNATTTSAHEALATRSCLQVGCPFDAEPGLTHCSDHREKASVVVSIASGKLPYGSVTEERLTLARTVRLLHDEEGLNHTQCAARLGISRSYACDLYADPDGSAGRARKDGYRQPCPKCGTLMTGSDGPASTPQQCSECQSAALHEERYWTQETIVSTFRDFGARFGRAPTVLETSMGDSPVVRATLSRARLAEIDEIRATGFRLPNPSTVRKECRSWADAVRDAGLSQMPTGGAGHRNEGYESSAAPTLELAYELLVEHGMLTPALLADARGITPSTAWAALNRLVGLGLAAHPHRGLYAVGDAAPPLAKGQQMRDFIVLVFDQEINAWRVCATTAARRAEDAIEELATAPGRYWAIPTSFQPLEVAPVTRLAVVEAVAA